MIPINELRIGSYVFAKWGAETRQLKVGRLDYLRTGLINEINTGPTVQVYENLDRGIQYGHCLAQDLQPIHLTPEVLEKCGFKTEGVAENTLSLPNQDDGNECWLTAFVLQETSTAHVCVESEHDDSMLYYGKVVTSLHELQNLYFALSGTELNYQP